MASDRMAKAVTRNLTGCLLVAAPHWRDPAFDRSVCLIVHHGAQGAIGVMLNRSLPYDGNLIWQVMGQSGSVPLADKLYLGGPSSGPVVALHQREDLAEFTSAQGVYFAAQMDYLKSLLTDTACKWRIYVGQATWQPELLERQFEAGCWLPLPVSSRVVFEDVDQMWSLAIREFGNRLVHELVGLRPAPTDVLWN